MERYINRFLRWELQLINATQNSIGEDNAFFMRVSKMSDPSYVINILFPVFASMNSELGMEVLLVSSVTEWANTILKWIFMENRPYWWIREKGIKFVTIRQNEMTCQTAPGSPSGHAMEAAAFLFVLINWCSRYVSNTSTQEQKRSLDRLMWTGYFIILTLVSISRVNVATHFPHQCLFGCIFGYLIAKLLVGDSKYCVKPWLFRQNKSKMILWATIMTTISFLVYFSHRFIGIDPGWSIKLAFKWCERRDALSVYSTPIMSLVRDAGCLHGFALAWPLKIRKFYPVVGATVAILFFVSTKTLRPLMPANDPLQFYSFQFLDYFFTALCVLTIVPYVASLVKVKEKKS